MKHTHFHLIETKCPRCGKTVLTGNRSLWGANEAKRKYNGICQDCITPEEREAMVMQIAGHVYQKVSQP